MKKWFLTAMAVTAMALMSLPRVADAADNVEFIHSLHLGVVDYKFHDCTPNCGTPVGSTGLWGISETLYYKGFEKFHPGLQVGFDQTTSMHVHHPGEINDRLAYVLLMVRVPVRKINFYAGVGAGSQFTQIVLLNGQQADCNHGGPVAKAGAEYMLTKQVGFGLEYMFANTHHDFESHDGGDGNDIHLKQDMHSVATVLAFHFN